jgi:hypothetical protein
MSANDPRFADAIGLDAELHRLVAEEMQRE